MAKKQPKVKGFSIEGFNAEQFKLSEQYAALIERLFDDATKNIANIAAKTNINADKPFTFADYPSVNKIMRQEIAKLADNMKTTIIAGTRKQWLFANEKDDAFLSHILDTSKLTKQQLQKYQDRNLDGLSTFQERKVNGMNLSDRVWKYVDQYKKQLEQSLDAGIGDGKSAAQLSRDVKQTLNQPDRLFRRIRDLRGNLHLSKNAEAFHPGQGIYRSSVRNAQRLTRSEINMAYREADIKRWQSMDFVIGYEVIRSNHKPEYHCDLCERLAGIYPKNFKFTGWHPQCRCYIVPILADYYSKESSDARVNRMRAAINGTEYKKQQLSGTITDVPQGFKEWVADNEQAQANWTSTPYFIKDNFIDGKLSKSLSFKTNKPVPVQQENKNPFDNNIREVENILGVPKQEEMTFEEANGSKGNINFSRGDGYRKNCQSCVVANELRRRGFDVTAKENTKQKDNIPFELSKKTELAWIDKETGLMPVKQKIGGAGNVDKNGRVIAKTIKQLTSELNDAVKEVGRYHINWTWKNANWGHIICLEKLSNGNVCMYDPQTGKIVSWAELAKKINIRSGVNVLRVDNLLINKDLVDGIVTKL